MNVAGYEHDEPMIYGKLAIEAHDAKIRAEAADLAATWVDNNLNNGEMEDAEFASLRAFIIAGESN